MVSGVGWSLLLSFIQASHTVLFLRSQVHWTSTHWHEEFSETKVDPVGEPIVSWYSTGHVAPRRLKWLSAFTTPSTIRITDRAPPKWFNKRPVKEGTGSRGLGKAARFFFLSPGGDLAFFAAPHSTQAFRPIRSLCPPRSLVFHSPLLLAVRVSNPFSKDGQSLPSRGINFSSLCGMKYTRKIQSIQRLEAYLFYQVRSR